MFDTLGDRMKNYEAVPKLSLMRRTPVILRVDGKAFHTFTKHADKPFDALITLAMKAMAKHLCENIQGAKFGYTQSDEVSILITDYDTLETDAWFGYDVQKMVSIAASEATVGFHEAKAWVGSLPRFDARVFNLPKEEVVNYFIWRQQDAIRNSISALARTKYSQKQLEGKKGSDMVCMLIEDHNIDWAELPTYNRRGTGIIRTPVVLYPSEERKLTEENVAVRNEWVYDNDIPTISLNREYVQQYV